MPKTTHPYTCVQSLRIATDIMIHPDFLTNHVRFCNRNDINLALPLMPETSFRKSLINEDITTSVSAIIHLVRPGAISMFVESNEQNHRLRSINIDPGMLLCNQSGYPLSETQLEMALNITRSKITPLLADPCNASHIVPDPAADCSSPSYWKALEPTALLPDLLMPCFQGLSHPLAGASEGASKKRIELRNDDHGIVIRFEHKRWDDHYAYQAPRVQGVEVTLGLSKSALVESFGPYGSFRNINGINRLVGLPFAALPAVFLDRVSQLLGQYLPIPTEWSGMGKPVTSAKVLALLAQRTGMALEDLSAMHERQHKPGLSPSSRKRLKKDLKAAADSLKPMPVSGLFSSLSPKLPSPEDVGVSSS